MFKNYSEDMLNNAYLSLTDEQKNVLDEHIKRGKKTKWLNIWAKAKGKVLTEEELVNPNKAMEKLLDWVLIDYEDALSVNDKLKCECGRSLRYRYSVLHKETGKVYRLGIVHFEQHTGLSSEMVRLVTNGLKKIDLERNEILLKVIENWRLPFSIPDEIEIPKDMLDQLRVQLPLLDRQIKRLEILLKKHFQEKSLSDTGKRFEQLKIGIPSLNASENKYVSDVQPVPLFNKLRALEITASEAKELYLFIKNYPLELENYGLRIEDIKKAVTKALGRTDNISIRKWLVEIEYLRSY